jgi:HEAT repeat protein
VLTTLLRDPSPALREAAAQALGGLNDTRAVPALVACTQDPEQSVRDAASTALDRMGSAAVIVAVATLLQPQNGQLEPSDGGPRELEEAVTRLIGGEDTAAMPAAVRAEPADPAEPAAVPPAVPPERAAPPLAPRPTTRRARLLNVLQSALDPGGPDGTGRQFPH